MPMRSGRDRLVRKNRRTRVVNKRTEYFDVYIGRGSSFGNKYIIGKDGTRKECIEKYRIWFYKRLKKPRFKRAVEALRGKRIGCTCKPLACHGDIIVEWLERQENEAKITVFFGEKGE